MQSSGVLIYDPQSNSRLPVGTWWLILECCPDLGRYYLEGLRRWYKAQFQVMKPAWGYHISIIRGEEPTNKSLWNKFSKKEIQFKYFNELQANGEYWWLNIECEELRNIRKDLGLNCDPDISWHLTVARRADL